MGAGRPRRTGAQLPEFDDPIEEMKNLGMYSEYENAFNEFLSSFADTEQTYKVSLFQINRGDKGTPEPHWVHTWVNDVPSYETVASFGAGKYRLLLIYTPKEGGDGKAFSKSVTFTISPKAISQPMTNTAIVSQVDNSQNIALIAQMMQANTQSMMQIMQSFMSTISNVLTERERNKNNGNMDLSSLQNQIGKMMLNNVQNTNELIGEVMRNKLQLPEIEEEKEDVNPLITFIKDMFNEWAPTLLGGNKTVQKMAASMLRKSPQYEQIEANPEILQSAVSDLIQENPENKNKVETLLKIFGINFSDQQETIK